MIAVEEGLLPHERSRERADEVEEERRLMFVGLTRAEQELQISMAAYRDFRGQRKMTVPSPFLMEIPRGEMELREVEPVWGDSDYQTPIPAAPARPGPRPLSSIAGRLTTAAEMANGGSTAPGQSPMPFARGWSFGIPNTAWDAWWLSAAVVPAAPPRSISPPRPGR